MSESPVPDVAVRTAAPHDLEVVVELAAAAIEEKRAQKGGGVWARRDRRRDPLERSLVSAQAADDHEVIVGTLDGVTVGYGVCRVEDVPDGGLLGVIEDLYVDPGARELGLGEALMGHLIDWCDQRNCFGVDSLALPGDRETKNFFESFGLVARAIIVHRPLR